MTEIIQEDNSSYYSEQDSHEFYCSCKTCDLDSIFIEFEAYGYKLFKLLNRSPPRNLVHVELTQEEKSKLFKKAKRLVIRAMQISFADEYFIDDVIEISIYKLLKKLKKLRSKFKKETDGDKLLNLSKKYYSIIYKIEQAQDIDYLKI